ncbi:MAG: nucleotide exchange factor GrpE [Candidatus Vogelbacteria bacterium CG10_big_fil_rev_8_21_14_0_10_45_14]|uniref:Protein GrpE n=1 Tax=Candidatus Vogelbacteria bacterium CG10_big_fil_rev_8_21_14_0_10_45_14 TaxID=1975042 RepID=A0A2H0RL57_9BACT|nr:MAG: nucleotide exchange factor GrpE [Candidatus Vogelbacteria bacterium CG10_big_fil_rev_8_21_14_0_10_45_14]
MQTKNNNNTSVGEDEPEEEIVSEGKEDQMSDENEDVETDAAVRIKKLKDDLSSCQKEKSEYLDGWQRSRADFANYKKGETEMSNNLLRMVEVKLLTEVLSIADGFDGAFSHKDLLEDTPPLLLEGLHGIKRDLDSMLSKHKVSVFGEVGEDFDPALHSAVLNEKTEEKEKDHKIAVVHKKGYMQDGVVLRPALVAVWSKD